MILCVIFVVLMMFWFFGGFVGPTGNPNYALAHGTIVPWACVAILGWLLFNGPMGGPR